MVALNVVFMGTPDFAIPPLDALVASGHRVQAVFCQPDRRRGRSRKPRPCPVKEVALHHGIAVHQPERIRRKKWVQLIRELAPDLIVVAAFGQILPQRILDAPRIDCINIHASLLPRWRGASPIHHAILAGDSHTGVAIMRMVKALDAGPVYRMKEVPIPPTVDKVTLEDQLAHLGANLLMEVLPDLADMEPTPQNEADVTYAPIIDKHMGHVNFHQMTAAHIVRMTRALEPWPSVICQFRGQPLKLLAATASDAAHATEPGTVVAVNKSQLSIACAENTQLVLQRLQPAGKKAMDVAAFINGYQPKVGEMLTSPSAPV